MLPASYVPPDASETEGAGLASGRTILMPGTAVRKGTVTVARIAIAVKNAAVR